MTEDDAIEIVNRWCGELTTRSATMRCATVDGKRTWTVELWRLTGSGRIAHSQGTDGHAGVAAATAMERAAKVRRA